MDLRVVLRAVCVLALSGVAAAGCFLADSPSLFAQSYGDKIPVSSVTLPTDQLVGLLLNTPGAPAAIYGYLKVPAQSTGRLPAVILMHGCGGVESKTAGWVNTLNQLGVATFVLDSFTGRGLKQICDAKTWLATASAMNDVYRSLVVLASRSEIDPQRIALMGFSYGGWATLWASQLRFQHAWLPAGGYQFAAYLAFYPAGCWYRLFNEEQVVDRPIRIFHGTADDWTLIGQCSAYVDRMRQAGKDVALTAYPGAGHGFDSTGPLWRDPNAANLGHCDWTETADGQFIEKSGRAFNIIKPDPCFQRGATGGGNDRARRQAVEDVSTFLRQLFKLGQ